MNLVHCLANKNYLKIMIKQKSFKRYGTLKNKILPHMIVTGRKNNVNVNKKQRQQREEKKQSETVRGKL